MLNMLSSRSMTNESQEYLLIEVKCNTCLLLSAKPSLTFATHSLALLFVLMVVGGSFSQLFRYIVECVHRYIHRESIIFPHKEGTCPSSRVCVHCQ